MKASSISYNEKRLKRIASNVDKLSRYQREKRARECDEAIAALKECGRGDFTEYIAFYQREAAVYRGGVA